jgi:hypothetical protein
MTYGGDPISRIENAFGRAGLVGWQFSADGAWEQAERTFFESPFDRSVDRIQHWLGQQQTDNVAFEALFEFAGGERFFFGVRITHLQPEAKAGAVQELLTTCQKGSCLSRVVDEARFVLGERELARDMPDYLELGVFDLWSRVKPVVVWKQSAKLGAISAIVLPNEIQNHAQRPDEGFAALHEPQIRPLILEAAWKQAAEIKRDFPCWVGLPVSEFDTTPERHTLSRDRYLSAAAVLVGHGSLELPKAYA